MTQTQLPTGFVRLSTYAPLIVRDMRYYGSNNFLGEPVDGYQQNEAILTTAAAKALVQVQTALAEFGLGLKIFDAYRPQQAVNHFLRWEHLPEDHQIAERFHPDLSKSELFAQGYIAKRSSHTRGSTVDLSLVNLQHPSHPELDMGTEFDFFGPASAPNYPKLTPNQRANRLLLKLVMEGYGFQGFNLEWWHFTLGHEPYPHQYFDFVVQ
ncbi:M15 family metallopeptidase [Thiothrix eikelboomii]|uniref:D-alanyl-D-alanine dipeptidase n=1 Tax=Thiothrix eikelboomii TaxID=92487 RepID=A0A1T4XCW4_9GAMM|nr:M15 family metallopeptidase [Thiothrix eikelboomii]SKA87247.1 D-alanyl-D-alanine dipeptidase [Thiothrix eikelboomii]